MSYFYDNKINNDNSGRDTIKWSTQRNNNERLRHRPHIANTSNSRGEGYVQYYSSLDADILFGGIFIDEVVNITWQVQQNAMPIFGYNSYTFDDIAVGSRLIQGQFTVNFIEANYLTRVLNTMTIISRKTYGEDIPATSSFTSLDRQIRNTPIWDKGFDIVVGYGERNNKVASEYNQVVMLDCCQLTGVSQALDYNGEPILETYSFIARDMKFVNQQTYINNNQNNNDVIVDNISNTEDDIVFTNKFINIFDNNNWLIADLEYDDNKIEVIELNVSLIDIDSIIFNTLINMDRKNNKTYYKDLTLEQKNAISNFVSKNNINTILCPITYKIKTENNDVLTKDTIVSFEIQI